MKAIFIVFHPTAVQIFHSEPKKVASCWHQVKSKRIQHHEDQHQILCEPIQLMKSTQSTGNIDVLHEKITKVLRIDLLCIMNVCSKFHGNPLNRC